MAGSETRLANQAERLRILPSVCFLGRVAGPNKNLAFAKCSMRLHAVTRLGSVPFGHHGSLRRGEADDRHSNSRARRLDYSRPDRLAGSGGITGRAGRGDSRDGGRSPITAKLWCQRAPHGFRPWLAVDRSPTPRGVCIDQKAVRTSLAEREIVGQTAPAIAAFRIGAGRPSQAAITRCDSGSSGARQ